LNWGGGRFWPLDEAQAALAEAEEALARARADGAGGPALEELERAVSEARWEAMVAGFAAESPDYFENAARASVHVLQLGPAVLVGIPGELFVEYGLEMKQRIRQTANRPMMLVGYANDYIGYIVTPRAKATGGYEQAVALVDEHAGRALTEAAMRVAADIVK
jgi:neutral ceramidase